MSRCRLQQKPGELGHLLEIIGDAEGFLGEIKTIHMGRGTVIRDLVPNPLDRDVHKQVAQAVVRTALEQKLNREDLTGYFDE